MSDRQSTLFLRFATRANGLREIGRIFIGFAAAVLVLAPSMPAHAQFSYTWDNGGDFFLPASSVIPPAVPNPTVADIFPLTGTVTNTSGMTLFFNGPGDSISSYAAFTSGGDLMEYGAGKWASGPYFGPLVAWLQQPGGVAPGATFTGVLTRVFYDSSTLPGLYDQDSSNDAHGIDMELTGHSASGTFDYFSPSVRLTIGGASSAPEPVSLALILPAALFVRRRRSVSVIRGS